MLVIGSGSGGEVVGLLRAGFNVVAVDIDHQQNIGLRARLVAEAEVLELKKEEMKLHYQQAMKDFARCQMHLAESLIDELWPALVVEKKSKKKSDIKEPEPEEEAPISGNCVSCDCDLNAAPSMWCPLCKKVARHTNCMIKCPSGEHVSCGKECVSMCSCVSPPVDAPSA